MRLFSIALGLVGMIVILHNGYWFWKGVTVSEELAVTPSQEKLVEDTRSTTRPNKGEKLGTLSIPSLELKLPIYQGTSEGEFKQGVGHYIKSGMPGENRHIVLSAHRDTVFRRLENIKVHDEIWVNTSSGSFLYKVHKTRIVDKNDRTVLVEKPIETLTLVTCYPFQFVGHAPQRLIVEATRLKKD
jgi:sortase A